MRLFDKLELRVPPLAVFATAATLMWPLAHLYRPFAWSWSLRAGSALSLTTIGVITALAGVAAFRRARTTLHPMQPDRASSLVNTGIYQVTRNPMYLGMLLVLAALAAGFGQPLAVLPVFGFVGYLNRFQINAEERAMAALFGEQYQAYRKRVRRWL
jgi:protein-S-isoprenylcysteine O-methyltransferase Ste14